MACWTKRPWLCDAFGWSHMYSKYSWDDYDLLMELLLDFFLVILVSPFNCPYRSVSIRSIPYCDVYVYDLRDHGLGFPFNFPLFQGHLSFQSSRWELVHFLIVPERLHCWDTTSMLVDIFIWFLKTCHPSSCCWQRSPRLKSHTN